MALDVKKAKEQFAKLHKESREFLDAHEDKEPSPEDQQAQDERFARMDRLDKQIKDEERLAAHKFAADSDDVEKPREPEGRKEFERDSRPDIVVGEDGKLPKLEFAKAFAGWVQSGRMKQEFATITTATESGVLLPARVELPIIPTTANVFRLALALHGQKPLTTPGTEEIRFPVLDGGAGGAVAEDASAETENTPSLAESILLKPTTYQSGSVWFSNLQLAALSWGLLDSVIPVVQESKELALEAEMIATMRTDVRITQTVTTSSTTGFTYGNLVDLNRKLPRKYDRLKVILLSKDAYTAAEKLTGAVDGHPILNRDPQNQELLRFNGTPVLRADGFEGLTANKTVGAVVSLYGFKLRDVTQVNLARYANVPAKPNQTGLNLFGYHAYGWAPSSVALLKTPVS